MLGADSRKQDGAALVIAGTFHVIGRRRDVLGDKY